MPLKARIDVAGALHHIIVRGIERRKIFYDDADRDAFVNRLCRVLIETQTGGIRIRLKLVACYVTGRHGNLASAPWSYTKGLAIRNLRPVNR